MSEIWPWEGSRLGPLEILKWKQTEQRYQSLGERAKEQWALKSKIIGEERILRMGKRYSTLVGRMACKRYLVTKDLGTKWIP